jgi:hypothetical protein
MTTSDHDDQQHSAGDSAAADAADIEIGETEYQLWPDTQRVPFVLKADARERHVHIAGQTGTGKSTLLERMIAHDLRNDRGIVVLDPHGSLAQAALNHVPVHRNGQVIYLDPTDSRPIGFNPLDGATPETAPRIADTIVTSFMHIFGRDAIGPQSADLLRNAVRALMFTKGSTLLGVLKMIDDKEYREIIAANVDDVVVRRYWVVTFPEYPAKAREEIVRPISNKLRALLSNPVCRNILGQSRSTIDLRRMMDTSQVLIANLNIGALGEGVSHLIGALLTVAITNAAFQRSDIDEARRAPVYLYIDEFQSFTTTAFANVLSQSRKFKLFMTMSHQFLEQLPDQLKSAVLGNAGTSILFRAGAEDASLMSRHMGLDEQYREAHLKGPEQLMTLPNFQAFVRTLDDGVPSTVRLFPHLAPVADDPRPDKVIARSRDRFGREARRIEAEIRNFYALSFNGRRSKLRQERARDRLKALS